MSGITNWFDFASPTILPDLQTVSLATHWKFKALGAESAPARRQSCVLPLQPNTLQEGFISQRSVQCISELTLLVSPIKVLSRMQSLSTRNFFLHLLDQQILGKYNKLLEHKSTHHTWSHYITLANMTLTFQPLKCGVSHSQSILSHIHISIS